MGQTLPHNEKEHVKISNAREMVDIWKKRTLDQEPMSL